MSNDNSEDAAQEEGKENELVAAAPISKKSPLRRILAVPATRLPHHVLLQIFQFLPAGDVRNCMVVCRHWYNVLAYEDSPVWRSLVLAKIPECALSDPYLLSDVQTYKQKLRAFQFAWNPKDASKNNYVRQNMFTMHRQPIAQSTDAIRGKIGVSTGIHAWDLTWEGPLGTVAVIGVATKHAALHCPGYVALLGSDDQSWGWNLVDNSLLSNGEQLGTYPRMNNPPKYQVGERIRLVIDCDAHCVFFERAACEFLGVAFSQLPPVKLYPAICAVYGNTEVSMVYVGQPELG